MSLRNLPRERLSDCAARIRWQRIPRGTYICRVGDPANAIFILAFGAIRGSRFGPDGEEFVDIADDAGLGDPYLSDLDREIIDRFRLSINLGRRSGARDLRPLSLETTKRRLVVLRQLLRYAKRQEWLSEDLGASIGIPVPTVLLPKSLRSDDLERLLYRLGASTLKERRDKAFLLLLLSTGARLSEVLSLDRSDLKPNGLSFPGRRTHQVAVLTKRARSALEAYLKARVDSCPALFIGLQPGAKDQGSTD